MGDGNSRVIFQVIPTSSFTSGYGFTFHTVACKMFFTQYISPHISS